MQSSFLVVFEDQMISHERGLLNHESATFSLESTSDVFAHTLAFLKKTDDHVAAFQELFHTIGKGVNIEAV